MFGNDEKKITALSDRVYSLRTQFEQTTKELKKDIESKTSDYEKEAAQSSRKASEYRNKIQKSDEIDY